MRYRLLGRTGMRISRLMLGAMTFADDFAHGADRAEARRIVDTYLDAGGNVVDTAINYRGGASEEIVGELLEGRRDRVVLATKFGVTRDPDDPNAAGAHRKNLRLSLETSLRRLRTDHVDLYYVHLWDRLTPIEETLRALDDAVRAGKVLQIGASDTPAWVIARADALATCHGWTSFAAIQARYNLLGRDLERELLPAAEALGMSVAAWSPLGGGVLSGAAARGTATDVTRVPAGSIGARERAMAAVVGEVAADLGATPAQVALAWTMVRSPAVHPILGVRRLDQLTDDLGALEVALPDEAVARLESASGFEPGFPHDFIHEMQDFVFGPGGRLVDP
jgi:aryl-alcohol dehydrogenase-like predicted oxidoreductase